jgi:glycerol-3-phosphate acyltransferase PlsY
MSWWVAIAAALSGYLLGALSFTRIAARLFAGGKEVKPLEVPVEGTDIVYKVTATGATAASMNLGAKAGCAIGLADMLKVAVPVLAFRLLYPDQPYLFIAGIAGMIGHDWPVFRKFVGGRGISAYYGGIFVIDWLGALVTMVAGMLLGFGLVRDFFVAYMSGMWLLIPWAWFTTHRLDYLLYAVAANVIFMVSMIPDIRQYLAIKKIASVDMSQVLATNPMGRGMMKMAAWIDRRLHR